jgi:F0F1-type ATP synthase membrane subunit b/b'
MIYLDANVIVVFLIVWVLLFILSRVFFNPVRRIKNEREKLISGNKDAYEQALASYERNVREIDRAIKQAKADAEAARASLEAEAVKEKGRLVAEVSAECRRQVEQAKADLDKSVRELKAKLESETEELAERIEKKLLN